MTKNNTLNATIAIFVLTFLAAGAYLQSNTEQMAQAGAPRETQEKAPDISGAQLVLFYSETCDACHDARMLIHAALDKHPGVKFQEVEVTMSGAVATREAVNRRLNVPQRQWASVPALYTQGHYYTGLSSIQRNLPAVILQIDKAGKA